MPPERAIEFKIELQPDTAPIAKALYKMLPVELKELKVQLQGMFAKGYIHPSTSPLGCSALCGLPTAQCSHHQEQVSTSMH
jgi:hypothetical protein